MKYILLVAAAAAAVLAGTQLGSARTRGGADIGPLGQCFSPPDCGGRNTTTGYGGAQACHTVRERVVTDSGHVIFRRHQVCS
jgi:hypothetical protein